MRTIKIILILLIVTLTISCKTINLEKNDSNTIDVIQNEKKYFVESDEKLHFKLAQVENVEPTIKFIENNENGEEPTLKGAEALKENYKNSLVQAEYENGKLKGWIYREDAIYEIQTQTYHSTFIKLEPGEQMLEEPYISEPDVWRISRGVSYENSIVTQHLVIKPDYSGLNSTLIIVTDRRIYHIELRSYKDRYMPIVKWVYPRRIEDLSSWQRWVAEEREKEIKMNLLNEVSENKKFISKDYKMSYSIFTHLFKKPYWLPTEVYDDGSKTYIVLDERVLHKDLPVLFNEKNELINYRVNKNILIVDKLINKMTLQLEKTKVVINKKKKTTTQAQKILAEDKVKEENNVTKTVLVPIDPIKRDDIKVEKEQQVESQTENQVNQEKMLPGSIEAINKALNSQE